MALTLIGIALVTYKIFGFSFAGYVFYSAEYYYLFYGIFGACFFLRVPARKKYKTIQWYDVFISS
jgi:hypothetical protein